MGIQFGGLSSGLPVNDIIDKLIAVERRPVDKLKETKQKQQVKSSEFAAVKSRVDKLQAAIKKITAQSVIDANLFQGKAASTSDKDTVVATAKDTASLQNYSVETERLATATKAASVGNIGAAPPTSTLLSAIPQKVFTSGTFKVFVNNVPSTITVDAATNSLGDVLSAIDAIPGVGGATINAQGALEITADAGSTLKFGSNGDTSNFLATTRLDTPAQAGQTYTASGLLSLINRESNDLTAAGLSTPVTAGSTFTIGKATFNTTGKSINTLIQEINSNSASGAVASFNTTTNKLELTSKSTGAVGIDLKDDTGNFLQAVGLINGADTLSSQTLGNNAKFTVNGTVLFSTSNTVDETVSGLNGLSLELKKTNVGSPVTLNVAQNLEPLTTALDDFVKQFNEVITAIDKVTDAKTGSIGPDSRLTALRNSLRGQLINTTTGAGEFTTLIQVGLSTGASTGAASVSTTLQLDKTKLTEAITKNASNVEALFKGTAGLFKSLQAQVDQALETTNSTTGGSGLFAAEVEASQRTIKRIDDQILQKEDRLKRRQEALRRQFTASESLISQYQSQGSAISGLSAQLSANNKG